jgi:putative phosphoribosyl transferase
VSLVHEDNHCAQLNINHYLMQYIATAMYCYYSLPMSSAAGYESIAIPTAEGLALFGQLGFPPEAKGIVVVAHALSEDIALPRNLAVRDHLAKAGFATLLVSLKPLQERVRERGTLNITTKARRLTEVVAHVAAQTANRKLKFGLFGVGSMGTAVLLCAGRSRLSLSSLVVAGGRPDLLGSDLSKIAIPTLLLAPTEAEDLLAANKDSERLLREGSKVLFLPADRHFAATSAWPLLAETAARWFQNGLDAP